MNEKHKVLLKNITVEQVERMLNDNPDLDFWAWLDALVDYTNEPTTNGALPCLAVF